MSEELYNNIQELIDVNNSFNDYISIQNVLYDRAYKIWPEISKYYLAKYREQNHHKHEWYKVRTIDNDDIVFEYTDYYFENYLAIIPVDALWSPNYLNELIAEQKAEEERKRIASEQNEEFNRRARLAQYEKLKAEFEKERGDVNANQ